MWHLLRNLALVYVVFFLNLYDNVKHILPKTVLKYLIINDAYNIDILFYISGCWTIMRPIRQSDMGHAVNYEFTGRMNIQNLQVVML